MSVLHNLLNDIQDKAEQETRDVSTLYKELQQIASKMYLTGMFNREAVVTICSNLIKMYALRTEK